ncbi:MAG: aminoacetone oxidase family FAD-binding enzyme, partial [Roseburia sp.]|nr:aminoacetone oxidase family FAD-binding enzyme [Roseburia sp.]
STGVTLCPSGYALARRLGHSVTPVLPALVQLRCEGGYFKAIAGVRAQAAVTLYVDGEDVAGEDGELQLTDYGISGIPVFQLSRIAAQALSRKRRCTVSIDFLTRLSEELSLDGQAHKTVEELLSGVVHKKLAALICRRHEIGVRDTVAAVGQSRVQACIDELRHFTVTVNAVNSFENAQVCSGGVPLSEVSEDFESLKCPRVYLVGELLDCDGVCGGYNLQWAWATGILAARAAARGHGGTNDYD